MAQRRGNALAVTRLAMVSALREGDAGAALRIVLELLGEGVPMAVVFDELLVPVQAEVGRGWQAGDVTVAEEHAGTAAIETLVAMLTGSIDQPVEGEVIAVACVPGDVHALATKMAAALLAYEGHRVRLLGASLPVEELAEDLELFDVAVLVLSCTRPGNLLGTRGAVAAAHASGVPVILGGQAFAGHGAWALTLGADAYAARLPDVLSTLESWHPDPAAAEEAARPIAPEIAALAARRRSLAGALCDAVSNACSIPVERMAAVGLDGELDEVVGVALAARHLDAPDLLERQLSWLVTLADARWGFDLGMAAMRTAVDAVLGH